MHFLLVAGSSPLSAACGESVDLSKTSHSCCLGQATPQPAVTCTGPHLHTWASTSRPGSSRQEWAKKYVPAFPLPCTFGPSGVPGSKCLSCCPICPLSLCLSHTLSPLLKTLEFTCALLLNSFLFFSDLWLNLTSIMDAQSLIGCSYACHQPLESTGLSQTGWLSWICQLIIQSCQKETATPGGKKPWTHVFDQRNPYWLTVRARHADELVIVPTFVILKAQQGRKTNKYLPQINQLKL